MGKRVFAVLVIVSVVLSLSGCAGEGGSHPALETTSATVPGQTGVQESHVPEEPLGVYAWTVEAEDSLPEFGGMPGWFWEDSREEGEFTARYYRFPQGMPGAVNDRVFVALREVENPYSNWYAQDLYEVRNGKLNKLEGKTVIRDYMIWGNKLHLQYEVTEYAQGKLRLTWLAEDGVSDFWFKSHEGSRWILGTTIFRDGKGEEYVVELDPQTGILTDPFSALPGGAGDIFEPGLFMSEIDQAEDGRLLVHPLRGEFYYLDTVNGAQYDLKKLTNANLQDCVAMPDWSAIYCWNYENYYWRIPTDTMIPQRLGVLQKEVIFDSGISHGDNATFSAERLPDNKRTPVKVYDYVNNVFYYVDGMAMDSGWQAARISPDGRKVLLQFPDENGTIQLQVFNCDTGELLKLHRTNGQWKERDAQWTEEGQIWISSEDQTQCCVYTLKENRPASFPELPEALKRSEEECLERGRALMPDEIDNQAVEDLAMEFTEAYLAGDKEGMKACMSEVAGAPPEYSGDRERAKVHSVTVYKSQTEWDEDRCDAFVKIQDPTAADGRYLYLGLARTGEEWKVKYITEG